MSKLPIEYLKHIRDEVEYLLKTSQSLTEEEFMKNETLQKAFTRSLEIIGEASKNIPQEFRESHNMVEWSLMARTRDRLIHHYFGTDFEIIWDVVTEEIPKLKENVDQIFTVLQY